MKLLMTKKNFKFGGFLGSYVGIYRVRKLRDIQRRTTLYISKSLFCVYNNIQKVE